MMVIVHEGSVQFQNQSLGWRSWNMAAEQPLIDYFTDSNACGSGVTSLNANAYETMTDGIIDGAVYDLLDQEPLVANECVSC